MREANRWRTRKTHLVKPVQYSISYGTLDFSFTICGQGGQVLAESEEIPVLTTDVFEDFVLKSSKPVVVFCFTKDSGLCNIKYDEFKQVAKKHSDKIKFLRLDIGRSKDLAFEHRVMAVPSMLCFKQGEASDRWSSIGYADHLETFVEKTMGSKFDKLPAGIVHVTEDNFKELVEGSPLVNVLSFWKSDHEPSWMLLPEFADMTEKYKGKVVFGIANFDGSRDLATQFRVFHVPTMLFFKKGESSERLVGIQSRFAVERIIRSLLEER